MTTFTAPAVRARVGLDVVKASVRHLSSLRRLSNVEAFEMTLLATAGAIAAAAIASLAVERDLLSLFPEPTPLTGSASLSLCLLVLAAALDGRRSARVVGGIAGLIGAVTLVQFVFSVDLAIGAADQRVPLNTAVALVLLGTAFAVPGRGAIVLAGAAFTIALAGSAAYTDPDLAALSQTGKGLSMALPTGIVLACVSIAFVLHREQAWFTRDTVGGTLVRRGGFAGLLLPLLGCALLLVGARQGAFSLAAGAWLVTIFAIVLGLVVVFLTARSLDRQQARATAELSMQAAIADNLLEGVCLRRESDGKILSVNPALERMFGYEPGTLKGTSQTLLADRNEEAIKRSLAEQHFWTAEAETLKADGQTFLCSVKSVLFEHPVEGPSQVALYSDVTERRASQDEREESAREREFDLIELRDERAESARDRASSLTELRDEREGSARDREASLIELERSNAELEQFAHVASHDLSEPLRVIGGFVGLIQRRYEGRLDADADRYIEATVSGVDRMQALIDALLSYARVGSGDIDRSMVNASEAAVQAMNALSARIEETGAEVRIEPLPTVSADAVLLARLFQNLIANSLKFSNGEAPQVDITAQRGQREWVFQVADKGIGIDPEYSEQVFGMFERLQGRQTPGTGTGLSISRRIAEKHGGAIWVEPRNGGGSVFSFTVPDATT